MASDSGAAERMVELLEAVRWDDDAAYEHRRSRGLLTREFLRRTAVWAAAVGAEEEWPFSDLAGAFDPEVDVDPALLERLEFDETSGEFPIRPQMGANLVRWAALGELPKRRFPEFDDPYEPLIALFFRGGGYSRSSGAIELGYGSFVIGGRWRRWRKWSRCRLMRRRWTRWTRKAEMVHAIDAAEAAEAQELLSTWWSARTRPLEPRLTPASFATWQVARYEEFLLYGPPSGQGTRLYLVGHGVVKPFSFATDTMESALEAARGERDGLIVPEPPRPSPF